MHVLVVDDREENVYYLTALLEGHGHQVDAAHHGAAALELARKSPPDVVISDLLMPVMDGYTLLREWKADEALREIPFVVYTATYIDPADQQLALSLGADAFILKPAEPDEFIAQLEDIQLASGQDGSLAQQPSIDERVLLREYSEVLIRKLEEKTLQLEESNRSLVRDMAARVAAESSLRDSEANFRLLTDAMPQLVWITRPDGWNIYFNEQWTEYTGLTAAESEGHGWSRPFHPDDRSRAEAAWRTAVATGERYSIEARLRNRDGDYRSWLVRALPRRDDDGAIVAWFGTCTDIEDLKESAALLHASEERLRHAQKMEAVGRLAGGVAHDFNNLLSVILGYAQMVLAELPPGARVRDDIREIQRSGERAATLTRQLLAFSRQQVLQPAVLNLNLVVLGMEQLLRRLLGEDIQLSLPVGTPIGMIHADPSQIEQIVLNLAVNARDAMPRGGTLRIETRDTHLDASYAAAHPGVDAGEYVMLSVADSGTGMDAETQARIFEPFFTTKEVGKGTGLGLATVFGIVKQSHGDIYVYSEPDIGTTFKLYFPRTDLRPAVVEQVVVTERSLRGTETILLVEDDEQVRELNRTILRRSGYNVIDAQNGGEAFLASEQFDARIHLLLTDVVMPRMSGRELAERLAPLRPEMKVLYVSGYTEDSIIHHGMLDAGIAFVPKPITPDVLLLKVREVLAAPN